LKGEPAAAPAIDLGVRIVILIETSPEGSQGRQGVWIIQKTEKRMAETRIEKDSMGEMKVPAAALYGAQTARALENFPISGLRFPRPFIRALGMIKEHAARVNLNLGLLDRERAMAIMEAAEEVVKGDLEEHFVLDIFQTGSGTSTNMNANEVIANRAALLMEKEMGSRAVHPNDHVNQGQSSNDVIPTAIHLAAANEIRGTLIPALFALQETLGEKSCEFDDIVKIGRTHLQDATPVRLGQVFSGYARQVFFAIRRLETTLEGLMELPLGGTAVGTGLNTHPRFAREVIAGLAEVTGLPFREAANHFEAQAGKDSVVAASGTLKTCACALFKIANDIRFLGSGPRCGLGEVVLPAVQPGSSIMPGKVNPVMAESLMQVCVQVVGNDAAVALGGLSGNFELNVMMPVMAFNLLQSVDLLARAVNQFTERCLSGLQADRGRCESLVEQSLAMCTALAPVIGYDRAAQVAKKAFETGKTVREVAREEEILPEEELEKVLDPRPMTEPGVPGKTR
jgi:fumarate hydratase class II